MTIYWLSFLMLCLLSTGRISRKHDSVIWFFLFISFVIIVGLRHEVGGDWGNYLRQYRSYSLSEYVEIFPLFLSLSKVDVGYFLASWISHQVDGDIYGVNLICAVLFFTGLVAFCRAQPLPFLAFSVAFPYLILVISMGYTRQAVALGFVMHGLKYLSEGGAKRYLFFIVAAMLFHKSASIALPMVIFYHHRGFVGRFFGAGSFILIMGYSFLVDKYETYWSDYVDSNMQSDGGLIRILMNLLPSILFLIYYKRIRQAWPDYRIWLVLSLATFALSPLVMFASTAVDRAALYFIPIQIAVFSRIPMLFPVAKGRDIVIKIILVYYAIVLFVWLNYGVHASHWLPYQNLITLDLF